MIQNIRHTGIVVKDIEASLKFYLGLGFTIVSCILEPTKFIDKISAATDINLKTAKLIAPDKCMIELLDYGNNTIFRTQLMFETGIAHIAFTVNNIWDMYKELCGKGIQFNSEPQNSPDGKAIVVFCRAPEGTFIELVEVRK